MKTDDVAAPALIPVAPVHGRHSRDNHAGTPEVQKVVLAVRRTIDVNHMSLSDAFYYSSLPLCVIDAVFSIGAKYASTKRVPQRWCEFSGWRSKRGAGVSENTVSDFLDVVSPFSDEELAEKIFANRQRTSTRSGILKAGAVRLFAKALRAEGINLFDDLRALDDTSCLEKRVKAIPGQKSGISLDYFLMLAGSDDYVKADRWICRFIAEALSVPHVTPSTAQKLLIAASGELQKTHPSITPRSLDHAIWKHMVS